MTTVVTGIAGRDGFSFVVDVPLGSDDLLLDPDALLGLVEVRPAGGGEPLAGAGAGRDPRPPAARRPGVPARPVAVDAEHRLAAAVPAPSDAASGATAPPGPAAAPARVVGAVTVAHVGGAGPATTRPAAAVPRAPHPSTVGRPRPAAAPARAGAPRGGRPGARRGRRRRGRCARRSRRRPEPGNPDGQAVDAALAEVLRTAPGLAGGDLGRRR